jgi:ribonucleoside-diphosphate reductase alpha chain
MLKAVETNKKAHADDAEIEIPVQPVSLDIWDKKYRLKTKTGEHVDRDMDDSYSRVARALADVETSDEKKAEWHEKFL